MSASAAAATVCYWLEGDQLLDVQLTNGDLEVVVALWSGSRVVVKVAPSTKTLPIGVLVADGRIYTLSPLEVLYQKG